MKIGNKTMLRLLFGKVEDSVMDACITYLKISAYSYPALVIYNSGAAVYRSLGKTNVTMYISVLSNMINVIGNVIGVFVLHMGVIGIAVAMVCDWVIRAFIFIWRQKSGKWKEFKVV